MDRLIAGSIILIVGVIGFVYIFQKAKHIAEKRQLAHDFLNKLNIYLNSQGRDYNTYIWLIQRSVKVQSDMGSFGILHAFRPPYANYMYQNYPAILNILPEIRKEFDDDSYLRNTRALHEYGSLLNESLLRYIGALDDMFKSARGDLRNPFIWLREGFQQILLLPLTLLHWLGVMGNVLVDTIAKNRLFKILAGIVALLGVLSAIMTIVIGWEPFINSLRQVFTSGP